MRRIEEEERKKELRRLKGKGEKRNKEIASECEQEIVCRLHL